MPNIVYMRDPIELFTALGLGSKKDEMLRILDAFDYAGGIILPTATAKQKLSSLPESLAATILKGGNQIGENFHFRSKEYYLSFVHNNQAEIVRELLSTGIRKREEQVARLSELEQISDIETRLVLASILDHKKHYSMSIFNTFFSHSLEKPIDNEVYENVKECCIADIANFYTFLLTGDVGIQGIISDSALESFEQEINLPRPSPPSFDKIVGEPTARKMIIREMDHPMQILLFAGQLIDQDRSEDIDFVINPLSGALEVGYAVKAIYEVTGFDKLNSVFPIKYSRYSESHEMQYSLDAFVPQHKIKDLDRLRGRRVFIIDDNTFSGNTLHEIRQMCYAYTSQVGIAAIERMSDLETERAIDFEELDVKPISKLRYVERVIRYIKRNNLSGLLKPKRHIYKG